MLNSFVPRVLIDWYRKAEKGSCHRFSTYEGVVVLLDASGFTALTRRLSGHGKEGPEILTALLNRFFDKTTQVIFQYHGDILKFAGDALWVYFDTAPDPESFFRSIQGAVDRVNAESDRDSAISIHIGAEFGTFNLVSLGSPSVRLEAEPIGSLLDDVQLACDSANADHMVIGSRYAARFSESDNLQSIGDGLYSLSGDRRIADFRDAPQTSMLPECFTSRVPVEPYVPKAVLEKLDDSRQSISLQSEHRDAAVLFANFDHQTESGSTGSATSIDELNAFVASLFDTITALGGSIARIDPYLPGHKLLVLFGAPQKKEDDALRTAKCAIELLRNASDKFRTRIGLAFGSLFCGEVGTALRKEYTVMGEAVNMAARLMSKADWGSILLDDMMHSRLPGEIITETITLELKGVGSSVKCHKYTGITEKSDSKARTHRTVGQVAESRLLDEAYQNVMRGSRELIFISGDAGVGKSELVAGFAERQSLSGRSLIDCRSAMLFRTGWLASRFLTLLISRSAQSVEIPLKQFIRDTVDPKWLPLMSDIVDQHMDDNDWTKGLTADLRIAKSKELFRTIVESFDISPQAVIIDELFRADELSRELILSLADLPGDIPLMLVAVNRSDCGTESADSRIKHIRLEVPSLNEWWGYFEETFDDGKRERELFERLLTASDCSPDFITEYVNGAVEQRTLIANRVTGKLEMLDSSTSLSLPSNLAEIQLSRFDSLNESDRSLLKVASAVRVGFSIELLDDLMPSASVSSISDNLDQLEEEGFLERDAESKLLVFQQSSMRDVIYNCIPEAEARSLHKRIAELLDREGTLKDTKALAFHYFRAQAWSEALRYSLDSAIDSSEKHSINESAEFLNQCAEVIRRFDAERADGNLVLRFNEEYAKSLSLSVNPGKAYSVCRDWRRAAKRLCDMDAYLMAAVETARLLWKQSRYMHCSRILSKVIQEGKVRNNGAALTRAYAVMAEVDRRSGRFAQAQDWCKAAIQLAEQENDTQALADSYNRLGLALWGQGKLAEAARNYERSLAIGEESEGIYFTAQTSNNLAIIRWELGDFLEAERLMQQAVEVFRNIGDKRNEAYASGNLANLYRIFGKLRLAEDLFLRADVIFERLEDTHAHIYTIGNLGDIDIMRGDLDAAHAKFIQVIEFARDVDDRELIAECGVRFGELAFFRRDFQEAESRFQEAIGIATEIESSEYFIRGSIGLARLRIWQRNQVEALSLIETIASKAVENKAVIEEKEAQFLKGEQYRISGRQTEAVECYQSVLDYGKSQHVFELILKSSCRLYELNPMQKHLYSSVLRDLAADFIQTDGLPAWNKIVHSAYFSFFKEPLLDIFTDCALSKQSAVTNSSDYPR